MKTLIICLIVLGYTAMSGQEKPQIIYVFDPLCGWCYGFSPVINKAYETYKDKADFKVITGGMIIGDQIGPIGKISQFLKGATARVTQRTGAVFSSLFLDTILTEGKQILTSMEPSIAIQICKAEKPDKILEFMSELQKDIYISGLKTAIPADYHRLAKKMGFDQNTFIHHLGEETFNQMALSDFQEASSLGIDSYPALLISDKGVVRELARGYIEWNELEKLMNAELSK
jgi:putative protein-disulfide isomerase